MNWHDSMSRFDDECDMIPMRSTIELMDDVFGLQWLRQQHVSKQYD
jgi:hypothetical protein